jgi:DNA-binding MarR family transcriptional regulator
MESNVSSIKNMSYAERRDRKKEKQEQILLFCKKMGWIDSRAAALLLNSTRSAAGAALRKMEKEGLVIKHELPGPPKRAWYSISERGMAEAFIICGEQIPATLPLGRQTISDYSYLHEQDVNLIAVQLEQLGLEPYLPKTESGGRGKGVKYPDLLVKVGGRVIALEIERTPKTQRRYKDILASHWLATEKNIYNEILYLCPDVDIKKRVQALVRSVQSGKVKCGGAERELSDAEKNRVKIGTYNAVLNHIKKQLETEPQA